MKKYPTPEDAKNLDMEEDFEDLMKDVEEVLREVF